MFSRSLTLTALAGLPMVKPGDDLGGLIAAALRRTQIVPQNADILVVAQKVVSKAEGRIVDLNQVVPSARAVALAKEVNKDARLVEVILSESSEVVRHRRDVLIVAHRLGFVMANAGVDQSNVGSEDGEQVLLLPRDPDASATALKAQLDREFVVNFGILINDSFGRAWRNGVVGVALGAAGIPALRNLVGMPDLFGRQMRVTEVALADEMASAASLLMGQAAEGQPVVHLRGLFCDAPAVPASALVRAKEMDLFR
ncbi:MAG: coenzyme F420-0:L-glutamate ligase [Rhizobiales bacterium]|nr:coenzyme F420-0:L-glutamate ligase [Hyphomicrobiales bacterium]